MMPVLNGKSNKKFYQPSRFASSQSRFALDFPIRLSSPIQICVSCGERIVYAPYHRALLEALMQLEDSFGNYIISLATQLPLIIVYFIGLIVAFIGRQKHPRASWFAIFGCAILLGNLLLMTGVQLWLPNFWLSKMHSAWSVRSLIYAIGILRSVIGAGGVALLLMAAFGRRTANQETVL
jgi:hypothetical protein